MKIRRYIESVAISLVAGILLETAVLPAITSANQNPEPTPFEVNLDLSFRVEVKSMK